MTEVRRERHLEERNKKMKKKIFSILLIAIMVLASVGTAFAQEKDSEQGGQGTITIENASKGETYGVVKVFGASSISAPDKIAYHTDGEIPEPLKAFFDKDSAGNVTKKAGVDDTELIEAVQAWAKDQTPVVSEVSDGSALTFTNLEYGYYAITSTQGAVVTLNSTIPSVNVKDKNTTDIDVSKSVDEPDVSIGDTATYTVVGDTTNYIEEDGVSQQVKSYTIKDTLPEFLKDVTITSVRILDKDGTTEVADLTATYEGAFPSEGIVIPWVGEDNTTNLYKNGVKIEVVYTAVVTDKATVDGTTGNINKVTLQPNKDKDGKDPFKEKKEDEEKIFTYAAALQKVDQDKKPLAGAEFKVTGLQATKLEDGVYRCDNDACEAGKETTLVCDSEGQLVILGLTTRNTLTATETKAPEGYNLLTETVTITPVATGSEIVKTSQTIYYDADGNVTDEETSTSYEKETYNVDLLKTAIVVVNQKGVEMPETGGMGTTILYIIGAALVLGAGAVLVTRRKADR